VTAAGPRHVVVGRLRKPHGLRGDCAVFTLTDHPAEVLAPGREVWVAGLDGAPEAGPLVIDRSRAYHREWLVAFRGLAAREAVEGWRDRSLVVPEAVLRPPEGDEVWLHELVGFAVVGVDGAPRGVVSEVYELPAGLTVEVQGPRREFLFPYRREFVREVDRAGRRLVVDLPDGMES
jgi:16S rRNA processing protein RimM